MRKILIYFKNKLNTNIKFIKFQKKIGSVSYGTASDIQAGVKNESQKTPEWPDWKKSLKIGNKAQVGNHSGEDSSASLSN